MKIVFDSKESKELFLKYAIPCGNVLIKRKKLSKARLDSIKSALMKGKEVRGIENTFRIAANMCYIISKKMRKKGIDKSVIRKYFWSEHSRAISWRHKIYKDFDTQLCKVYPGRVIKMEKAGKVLVLTPIGNRRLRKEFIPDLAINDLVTVHYNYCIEKITHNVFKSLWNKYK